MNRPFRLTQTLLILLVVLVAAVSCSRNEPQPEEAAAPDTVAAEEVPPAAAVLPWTDSVQATPDAILTISEYSENACSDKTFSASIQWDVAKLGTPTPQIWVATATEAPKLWVAPSRHTGSKRTGEWLRKDATIYLVDGGSKRVLNKVAPQVPTICP